MSVKLPETVLAPFMENNTQESPMSASSPVKLTEDTKVALSRFGDKADKSVAKVTRAG
jgi:hypothetical protein